MNSPVAQNARLPGIEGLEVAGKAFPGHEVQACGYSINGTTSVNFKWVRFSHDGSINYIDGATKPSYVVTGDDVDFLLAVEAVPVDNKNLKGEAVMAFANEKKKITCGEHIEKENSREMEHLK